MVAAELGNESDGGRGVPEFDVVHNIASGLIAFVAIHPAGRAGGVRASKFSVKTAPGLEQGVGVAVRTDGVSLAFNTNGLAHRRRMETAVEDDKRFIFGSCRKGKTPAHG